jgi:undecaprenyl-diphosphatase
MNWLKNLSKKNKRLLFMAILILICVISLEEIVDDVFSDPSIGDPETLIFDKAVMRFIGKMRSPLFNQVMIDMTALGSVSVIGLLVTILLSLLIIYRDKKALIYSFFIFIGSAIIPNFLKGVFMRARPDVLEHLESIKTHSFPSAHAFSATVTYFSLAFLLSRSIARSKMEIFYYFLAVVIISLVGLSRIFLGVHYPTDIFAGSIMGFMWFLLVSMPFVYLEEERP